MIKYKLTTPDMKTRKRCDNETTWKVGEFQPELSGEGDLCGPGWYHYYHHPLLAVLMNPSHANIDNPRGWKVNALGKHIDDNGIKGGCTKMRLIKEIKLPEISRKQRIAFAILCAKEVCKDKKWNEWADDWLSGKDRTAAASAAFSYASDAYAAYAAYAASAYAASAYAAFYASDADAFYAAYEKWTYKKLLAIANKAMGYS